MTDAERQPDGRRPETDPDRTESPEETAADPSRTASFRTDGGPGSVLRERQPGYGGMDAREAADGEPSWQAVTSDRYGHRVEEQLVAEDASPEREPEPEADAPGDASTR